MKPLFFIFLLIMTLGVVTASGFSPSSLTFSLEGGEEECQTVTVTSDSEKIEVSDKWAENKDSEWSVSGFQTSSSAHGISIKYDNELSLIEREVDVCLSGSKVGEYRGVLLLQEEQEGSSVVQMGIWLKVIISEKDIGSVESDSSGPSGSGGGLGIPSSNYLESNFSLEETLVSEDSIENVPITGSVVGGSSNMSKIIYIFVGLLLIGLIFTIFRRK